MMAWEMNNLEIEWNLFSALVYSFVVDCAQNTNKLTN